MQSYVKDHGIEGLKFKFFNSEAVDWYDPLKPYTLLEYEWVRKKLNMKDQVVFDAGAHHGNYSVVFLGAKLVVGFEMMANLTPFIRENLELNFMTDYSEVYNVQLRKSCISSDVVDYDPDIYKMDIEGDEFDILPLEIAACPNVHTWIIEVHPHAGNPEDLEKLFDGFELLKVDRELMEVRRYRLGEPWPGHATLIATKHNVWF